MDLSLRSTLPCGEGTLPKVTLIMSTSQRNEGAREARDTYGPGVNSGYRTSYHTIYANDGPMLVSKVDQH